MPSSDTIYIKKKMKKALRFEIPYEGCKYHLQNNREGLVALDELWLEFNVYKNDPDRAMDAISIDTFVERFSRSELGWGDIEYQFIHLVNTFDKNGRQLDLLEIKYQCLLTFCQHIDVYREALERTAVIQLAVGFRRLLVAIPRKKEMGRQLTKQDLHKLCAWFRDERPNLDRFIGQESDKMRTQSLAKRTQLTIHHLQTEILTYHKI